MKEQFNSFYNNVVKRPHYWAPVLFFAITAFGFSMFNRSISTDDLWSILQREDNTLQGGRWGMSFWSHLLGVYTYSPFIDEYLTMLFSIMSAVGISFLLYIKGRSNNVLGYTFFSSILVTYPLIIEILNYNGANFYSTGGLLLGTLALLVWDTEWKKWAKYVVASLLLVLPAASYEASVFSYFTLFCIVTFYKYVVVGEEQPTFKSVSVSVLQVLLPLFFAVIVKFAVPFVHNLIFQTEYTSFGATEIGWTESGMMSSFKTFLHANIYLYVIQAIIYFPITEFLICVLFFCSYAIWHTIRKRSAFSVLSAGVVVISLFSLAIVQGAGMPYRTASSLSLFVAFVVFLFYQILLNKKNIAVRWIVVVCLFALCWHQSAFVHRVQSLNNLRADNEAAAIHHVGLKLKSDFDQKPVVFVSGYDAGGWIEDQVCVDVESFSSKFYRFVCNKLNLSSPEERIKIIGNNVNPYVSSHEILTPKMIFRYFGYDIDVVTTPEIIKQAVTIAKEKDMRPYQIEDYGPFIIVQLSGKHYFEEE